MKRTTKTKVHYSEKQTDGSEKRFITSETAFNRMTEQATKDKEELPGLVAKGTFGYSFAENVDEAVALCGGSGIGEYENVDVFLSVFNYAAGLRQDNAANDLLTDSAYVELDEPRDVSSAIAEKAERTRQTPEEKYAKALGITPEQLRAALATIRQQQSVTA